MTVIRAVQFGGLRMCLLFFFVSDFSYNGEVGEGGRESQADSLRVDPDPDLDPTTLSSRPEPRSRTGVLTGPNRPVPLSQLFLPLPLDLLKDVKPNGLILVRHFPGYDVPIRQSFCI